MKKTNSYQRAQAIADKMTDALIYCIDENECTRTHRNTVIRSYLYAAAHGAIVGEMRRVARERRRQ